MICCARGLFSSLKETVIIGPPGEACQQASNKSSSDDGTAEPGAWVAGVMATATIAFDPFQPEMLQKAFKAASPGERPALLSAATETMADGLRGISGVVRLVDDDATSFEAGLKLTLQKNPRNLTAARALIWFHIRAGNYAEAEREYEIIERHWPQYNELIFEHLRVLVVGQAEQKLAFFLEKGRFFKSPRFSRLIRFTGRHG